MRGQRHRVRIMKRSRVSQPDGEAVDSFTFAGTEYCSIVARTTREQDQQGRYVLEETVFNLEFRKSELITALTGADQIHHNGQVYEPTGTPLDKDGRGRKVTVPCRIMKPTTHAAS